MSEQPLSDALKPIVGPLRNLQEALVHEAANELNTASPNPNRALALLKARESVDEFIRELSDQLKDHLRHA
jgi:hypothetical protein